MRGSLQLCLCHPGVEHGQHDLHTDPAETPGQCNSSSRLQRAPLFWSRRQHCQGATRQPLHPAVQLHLLPSFITAMFSAAFIQLPLTRPLILYILYILTSK